MEQLFTSSQQIPLSSRYLSAEHNEGEFRGLLFSLKLHLIQKLHFILETIILHAMQVDLIPILFR